MTELINSLKTLAYGGSGGGSSIADRRSSTGQLRIIPLLNLGRNDSSNDSSFTQWRDAMRMVARLPGGLPPEFRLRLWENLSDRYMQDHGISWSRVMAKCRLINSRDTEIADQIEKDLHRTGCTGFEGGKQAMLKRVLVSYSRWNPSVGYCQGFNMIGAMLLQMTSGDETLTLKVLIFLIEGILPQGYFSQGLRGLAVDMAVFREILRLRKPTLHNHLSVLQNGDENPPLTDVFTMHWFLTLFIHCLPTNSVLRIWDLVFLEGSEVLLRTALVLWTAIEPRILAVNSADEFYSVMGVVTREMLEFGMMDPNALVKCIVSVGPFPFPGLGELRQQQRAIIQQDTPYKSFFLAKRELDNLKRHYAAMKDRQKATTIILKGLETSRIRVPGQRSNSLFVAPTMKKQMVNVGVGVQNKPKMRRASSGSKGQICNNNNTNINNGVANNLNNLNSRPQQNGVAPVQKVVSGKQVTMTWDKAAPKIRSKQFRRRRTASASSGHNTDSSSDTELCDSNSSLSSDSSDSEGVWSETDGRWKKPKANKKSKTDSPGSVSLKSNKSNLSLCPLAKDGDENVLRQIDQPLGKLSASVMETEVFSNGIRNDQTNEEDDKSSLPPLETPEGSQEEKSQGGSGEDHPSSEEGSPPSTGKLTENVSSSPKILDTNDSQHFLEEISRLGKSDSFYENLSKRICELQFQNLKILNSCQTTIDPKSLMLPEFVRSPLPSPISTDKSLAGDLFLQDSSLKLIPVPTPKAFLSPRGSVSSLSDCLGGGSLINSPMRSPLSPIPSLDCPMPKSRRSSYSRRTSSGNRSSQSVSSMDIPDICVDAPNTVNSNNKNNKHSHPLLKKSNGHVEEFAESSEDIADSVSHFIMSLSNKPKRDTIETTSGDESSGMSEKAMSSPRKGSGLTLDLSGISSLGTSGIKPFTPLKTPDFLQLNSLSDTISKEPLDLKEEDTVISTTTKPKNAKTDVSSCLVSPILSPDLTETSLKSRGDGKRSPNGSPAKDIVIPPRPKNFPVSPVAKEEFLLAYTSSPPTTASSNHNPHLDNLADGEEDEFLCRSGGGAHGDGDECGDICNVFPTTACPCQCQTTEEINAVIRQNIAILQRLKLKPAYELAMTDGAGGDDEYEDLEEFEEGSSCSDCSGGYPELSNFSKEGDAKGDDSSDRDSGVPTCSSKNSLSRKDSCCSGGCRGSGRKGGGASLRHQDSSGCSSGGSSSTIATTAGCSSSTSMTGFQQQNQSGFTIVATTTTQTPMRRRNSSGGTSGGGGSVNRSQVRRKSLTRTGSGGGQAGNVSSGNSQKRNFNPFPTTRRARVRTTKFGLYN